VKKILFMRGPDGAFHEFHRTGENDEWSPIPFQDMQIQSVLTGAGWYVVVSVRPVYSGSSSHTSVRLELANSPTTVYAQHLEVYLEEKRLKACQGCGMTALAIARFCYHCGAQLPADGAKFTQPPLAPRQGRKST
jgi:hypothetical protein